MRWHRPANGEGEKEKYEVTCGYGCKNSIDMGLGKWQRTAGKCPGTAASPSEGQLCRHVPSKTLHFFINPYT